MDAYAGSVDFLALDNLIFGITRQKKSEPIQTTIKKTSSKVNKKTYFKDVSQ